jgi:hypothetical protein
MIIIRGCIAEVPDSIFYLNSPFLLLPKALSIAAFTKM